MSGASLLPAQVETAMKPVEVPDELITIASVFVDLQGERHQADYDLSRSFLRREALNAQRRAKDVIKNLWPTISQHDATQFFLVSLMAWYEIRR